MASSERNTSLWGSIKEIHDSETAREYLDDIDQQRSTLLTFSNLRKGTFQSPYRMYLRCEHKLEGSYQGRLDL